jgi:hypothetical protein
VFFEWIQINDILESDFCHNDTTVLEEESASMKVELNKRGSKILIYKFDKQLNKDFKGGLFPFLAKNKGVCSICDYIIFVEKNNNFYALIIELKKGKSSPKPQLIAAECFVNYIIATMNRVNKINSNIIIRKIGIHESRRKWNTKMKEVEFDENNYYEFRSRTFRINAFL